MAFDGTREYLVSNGKAEGVIQQNKFVPLQDEQPEQINGLSHKERALRFEGFVVTNEQNSIIFEDRKKYSQHFFEL